MARKADEQPVVEAFAAYLSCETLRQWQPSPDEVSTFKNNRKYDCEFTCPGQEPIAADICALFPLGSHQQEQAKRWRLVRRLEPELEREGLGGLMIKPPPVQKKHANPDWPKMTASKIREALKHQPPGVAVEVEGCTVERIAEDAEPLFFHHSESSLHQPIEASGYALVTLLKKKHEQLNVDDHQRFLIVVNAGQRAHAKDVTDACAFINFEAYPNFDRLYFEESPGNFYLVYDRQAFLAMEAEVWPIEAAHQALVARWIRARLSGGWPGTFDTALRISWQQHSTEWLTQGGSNLLEIEAQLFLKNCGWQTPVEMWVLFRGRSPLIADGRRKIRPIG